MSSAPPSPLPNLGVLLRLAWQGFKAKFWIIVLLTAIFSVANLIIQIAFFGAVAWGSFVDYFSNSAAETSFGIMPLFVSLSGFSPWVLVPVMLITLCLQVWYHGSLVGLVRTEGATLSVALQRGFRKFLQVAAQFVALFLVIRVVYFVLAFIASLVFHYLGYTGGSAELVNRLFLLLFACAIVISGIIAGFALFYTMEGVHNPLIGLRKGFEDFRRAPWAIFWRALAALMIVYVAHELVAQIQLNAIPLQWQAILSLFSLPFLLFFLSACRQSIIKRT